MQLDLTKYSPKELSKIIFISNAIDDGWTVKKEMNYIFFQDIKVRKNKFMKKNI